MDDDEAGGFVAASRAQVLRFAEERFGTRADYPWMDKPEYAVLRHARNGKWYGLILPLPQAKLKGKGDALLEVMNVKCGAQMVDILLVVPGVYPAWHMNKDHWVSVVLAEVSAAAAEECLADSFRLTGGAGKRARSAAGNGSPG